MRVLIVTCVFPPEPVISAQTSEDVARALAERGHAVTVVTAYPNRPAGKLHPGYSRRLFQRSLAGPGFSVLRCFSFLSTRSHLLSRFLENVSFGVTSSAAVLLLPRPDVIYANTWPLAAAGLIVGAARLRAIPVVLSLQDVYPESLMSQGRLAPTGRVARFLRKVDECIVQRSASLIAISPSFARLYAASRRVRPEKLTVVPNWVDSQTIQSDDRASATVRAQCGIPAKVRLAVYGGNVGIAAGVETLVETFKSFGAAENIRLLIAGEGSQLASCQQRARGAGGDTISFYTPWPKSETSRVLGAADVLVLPTRGQQSLASVPSKLITYMLAARPVVALALPDSDLASVVDRSGCGWVVPPDQPAALAAQLRAVLALPAQELERRGKAGRDYALRHFVGEVCLPRVVQIVERAAARN